MRQNNLESLSMSNSFKACPIFKGKTRLGPHLEWSTLEALKNTSFGFKISAGPNTLAYFSRGVSHDIKY